MSNYNQTNIYRKQMNKLKLNAKQYAELTGMPYEVVKDILYDKEGDYSMEIKNLLRKNMMNKHQEIENNYETEQMKKVYNYINNNVSYDSINEAQEQDIVSNTLLKLREEQQSIFMSTKEEPKIEIINNDDIMRKILVSRLTEEEKALIELFGGKIC